MIFLDLNSDSDIVSTDLIESGSNVDPETVLSTELATHAFLQNLFFETLAKWAKLARNFLFWNVMQKTARSFSSF